MLVKQCHKPPIYIEGFNPTHKNGENGDGGSCCFTTSIQSCFTIFSSSWLEHASEMDHFSMLLLWLWLLLLLLLSSLLLLLKLGMWEFRTIPNHPNTIPKPSNPGENGWRVSGTSVAAMVTLIGHLMQKCGKSFPICRGNIWKYVHELRLNFKSHMDYISKREMLVCGLEHFSFFHILGMSSSQLTFIFFRGVETTNQNGINMWIHVTVFGVSSWRTRAPGGFKKKICPDWILP